MTASDHREAQAENQPDPIKGMLDRFFYAPLSAVSATGEELDEKAKRGREQFASQVRNARFLGEMVIGYGSKEVERRIRDLLPSQSPSPNPEEPSPVSDNDVVDGGDTDGLVENVDRVIPDYEALSASQVVKMLEGLSTTDLEILASYEAAHRRRTTILNRIEQLASST